MVECEEKYSNFLSGDNKSMTRELLVECWRNGFEIACPGHTHKNSAEDVCANIAALKSIGIDKSEFGFVSPNSEVTHQNYDDVRNLLKTND